MSFAQPTDGRRADEILKEAFGAILKEAPRKLKDLRDECSADLERLHKDSVADDSFKGLRLALEASGAPKVVCLALEATQRLLQSGSLTGNGPDPFNVAEEGSRPRHLIDTVVESIAGCADAVDEQVQLRQVAALVTAVTSSACNVHGATLLTAVNTCFKVFSNTKSPGNQKNAETGLKHMLNHVTQRMETSAVDMSRKSQTVAEAGRQARLQDKAEQQNANTDLHSMSPRRVLNDFNAAIANKLVDDVIRGKEGNESGGKFGWCVVCREPAPHYCVETGDPVCGKPCKLRNLERINVVNQHFETGRLGPGSACAETTNGSVVPNSNEAPFAVSPTSSSAAAGPTSTEVAAGGEQFTTPEDNRVTNPFHGDLLITFDFLCKQSMKDTPTPANQVDNRAVKAKKISLDLIHEVLRTAGPVVRSSEKFLDMLRQNLVASIIKNSVCNYPKLFGVALNTFLLLISSFKEHLNTEIGILIEHIFLRILETGNSTFQHKHRVLSVFYKLCTDASIALELFLNFDCDVEEKNIFERMIDCLSKIAQGKYTSLEHSSIIQPHQEQELKMLALNALVTLMGSVVDWARRMGEEEPRPETNHEDRADNADSEGEDDSQSNSTRSGVFSGHVGGRVAPNSLVSQKQRKLELQIGINKFNMKPKRGIEYLRKNGFLSDEPSGVADLFLKGDVGLDKTSIGDFLGEDKPFNKAVLHALVDRKDFKDQDLDQSLRSFLAIFRLPGEAQKIDRMMETFAEKYCQDNPATFQNADCAFVLSFALIMLQTDLHNPGVKNKMTKEQFISNNRGINNNQDLPREFLERLYDSVSTNPISLKEDQEAQQRLESQAAQNPTQKMDLFTRECETMVAKSQAMMKERATKTAHKYVAAQSVDHVRPLFEIACWPYLATLAVLLETSDDTAGSIDQCIEGFKHCIRIAARFDMDTERDAFVSSLAKFTYLTTIKEMKQKNIECIKALLAIGLSEGNNLGPSWQYVLLCISQLQRLELIGSHRKQDFLFFGDEDLSGSPQAHTQRSNSITSMKGGEVVKRRAHGLGVSALVALGSDDRQVELSNSESIVSQIDVAQIELLFNRTTSLNASAIVHFVTSLARVSKDELCLADQPRIFSLQKLVEVAAYNMGRSRLEWQRMWRSMSRHLVEVGAHSNIKVCTYAIDSIRQLAWKFLDKEELSMFQFQADFLQPFETLVTNAVVHKDVKLYIVSIIALIVQNKMANLKSGWKVIFATFAAAARECSIETVQTASDAMEFVLTNCYDNFIHNFADGVGALVAFGHCQLNPQMSVKAVENLIAAAESLAKRSPTLAARKEEVAADADAANRALPAGHWLPVLRGLSELVSDPRKDVRSQALEGLFDCLQRHGHTHFDEETWRMVFNCVIKPLFDDTLHQFQASEQRVRTERSSGAAGRGSWAAKEADSGTAGSWAAKETNIYKENLDRAVVALVRLFDNNLDSLVFLLDDILRLIESCINVTDIEAAARAGVDCLKQLLEKTGNKLSPESWAKAASCIKELFAGSMPRQLMCVQMTATPSGEGELPFRRDDVVLQCIVQLFLIDMLQTVLPAHFEHIPQDSILQLLDALQGSYEFAQQFNQDIESRQTLKRLGFIREMRQLPGLFKQERESLSCSLRVLFQMQSDPRMDGSEQTATASDRLIQLCCLVIRSYVNKERIVWEQGDASADQPAENHASGQDREVAANELEREVVGMVPIISDVVLCGLRDLKAEHFRKHVAELFPILCDLATVHSREVRDRVRSLLLAQVGPILA